MLDPDSLRQLFTEARTHTEWTARPVSDAQCHALYDLMKWGPTSANCCPARIVFVKSPAAKALLIPCMETGNQRKVSQAPVTAIIGMDLAFYEKLPQLYPPADARAWFVGKPELIEETAFRNSSLQGAYLILAARSLGLDCGPMSGFKADRVNAAFFSGTTIKANFVCNLGYAAHEKVHPRLPRLDFKEACRIA